MDAGWTTYMFEFSLSIFAVSSPWQCLFNVCGVQKKCTLSFDNKGTRKYVIPMFRPIDWNDTIRRENINTATFCNRERSFCVACFNQLKIMRNFGIFSQLAKHFQTTLTTKNVPRHRLISYRCTNIIHTKIICSFLFFQFRVLFQQLALILLEKVTASCSQLIYYFTRCTI